MWYFVCFCVFCSSTTLLNIRSPDTMSCIIYIIQTDDLKIYLSWPYFFSWSPKGYLRIFLILSPVWVALLCFIFLNFLVIMLFLLRSIAFLKKESILFMVIITLQNDSLPTSAQSSYQSYSPQMELLISNCKISFLIYFSLSR